MAKTIDRKIRGIRTSIPSGYVLGRTETGEGDVHLISIRELGGALTSPSNGGSGASGSGVASGSSVSTLQSQQAGTNSIVRTIVQQITVGTYNKVFIQRKCGDETTAITAGNGKETFRMPCTLVPSEVRASLTTAQATNGAGGIFTVDLKQNGSSVLSTLVTIDNTLRTSTQASTPPVISSPYLYDDAEMRIDVTQIGDGTAAGLKLTIIGVQSTAPSGRAFGLLLAITQ